MRGGIGNLWIPKSNHFPFLNKNQVTSLRSRPLLNVIIVDPNFAFQQICRNVTLMLITTPMFGSFGFSKLSTHAVVGQQHHEVPPPVGSLLMKSPSFFQVKKRCRATKDAVVERRIVMTFT